MEWTTTQGAVDFGLDEISLSAITVPAVKQRIRQTNPDAARNLADGVLACETWGEVQAVLDG